MSFVPPPPPAAFIPPPPPAASVPPAPPTATAGGEGVVTAAKSGGLVLDMTDMFAPAPGKTKSIPPWEGAGRKAPGDGTGTPSPPPQRSRSLDGGPPGRRAGSLCSATLVPMPSWSTATTMGAIGGGGVAIRPGHSLPSLLSSVLVTSVPQQQQQQQAPRVGENLPRLTLPPPVNVTGLTPPTGMMAMQQQQKVVGTVAIPGSGGGVIPSVFLNTNANANSNPLRDTGISTPPPLMQGISPPAVAGGGLLAVVNSTVPMPLPLPGTTVMVPTPPPQSMQQQQALAAGAASGVAIPGIASVGVVPTTTSSTAAAAVLPHPHQQQQQQPHPAPPTTQTVVAPASVFLTYNSQVQRVVAPPVVATVAPPRRSLLSASSRGGGGCSVQQQRQVQLAQQQEQQQQTVWRNSYSLRPSPSAHLHHTHSLAAHSQATATTTTATTTTAATHNSNGAVATAAATIRPTAGTSGSSGIVSCSRGGGGWRGGCWKDVDVRRYVARRYFGRPPPVEK